MIRKTLAALSLMALSVMAQPLTLERPVEKTKHSPWVNLGVGVGVLAPTSDEYQDQSPAFLRLALLGDVQFWPMTSMTFDLNYTAPQNGLGLLVGLVDTMGRAYMPQITRQFFERSVADAAGPALASMLIYLFMAAILAVRPGGLFPVNR